MKYIIVAPLYTQKSAGIFVLYELQKWLIKYGKEAMILNFGFRKDGTILVHGTPEMIDDDDIVVYPEIVTGNPLKAKKVVRYILNEPGKLGGDKEYDKNEILVAFDDTLAQFSNGNILRIPHIEDFFTNLGYERTLDCFWVGKGNDTKHTIVTNAIEISYQWPKKRRELAELFNRTRAFYSYDDRTALITEAQLCGCNVKLLKNTEVYDALPLYLNDNETMKKEMEQFIALTSKESSFSVVESMDIQIREKLDEIERRKNEKNQVSIIIPLYNQLDYTKECITSIKKHTNLGHEVIFVNNGSSDNTGEWISKLVRANPNYKIIDNKTNLGFPKAINQGINASTGRYILIANNDIVVTPGWLDRMIEVAESDVNIGIVGTISNFVSGVQMDNNAKYSSIPEMEVYAQKIRETNKGKTLKFPRVAFLCTLIKKEIIEILGGLDERFTPGNFEDDDFCLRAQMGGFKTVIAGDVFIHHFGSVSFKAKGGDDYGNRLAINQKIFIDKWGADPEEIWLQGKEPRMRNIVIPLDKNRFSECLERGQLLIQEEDFVYALENFEEVLQLINESPTLYPKEEVEQLELLTEKLRSIS